MNIKDSQIRLSFFIAEKGYKYLYKLVEESKMKNVFLVLGTKVVDKNVKAEANSTCAFMAYQPKMPESVRKLRKEKK
ncbi:MAG: cyclic lactone autoinducer peptide [Roseburia sp.]|nr:cyclic lactone autoinducer peptide [Roseburia sp.]